MKHKLLSIFLVSVGLSISASVFPQEIDCSNTPNKAACENLKRLLKQIEEENKRSNDLVRKIQQQMTACNKQKPLCDSGDDDNACSYLKKNCAGQFRGFEKYK